MNMILQYFIFHLVVNMYNLINFYIIQDSLSQISEIIFSNNIVEKNNVNCHVFAIKTEQNQDLIKNRRKKHKSRKDHHKLLEICNPQNLVYGICFRIKEVMDKEKQPN